MLYSCTPSEQTVSLWGEDIKINGNPDSNLIRLFECGDVDYVFSFSEMMTLSIIIEVPYVYHCFIVEQVLGEKRLSYLKIDDASRFHFVPQYDSLNYDMKLRMQDLTNGLSPSLKFDSVPLFRAKSEIYNQSLVLSDDVKEFTNFYNKSLYFQGDSTIGNYYRDDRLFKLIEILLVRLVVSPVFDDYPYLDCIFLDRDMYACGGPVAKFYHHDSDDNPAILLEEYISKWNEWYNAGSFISKKDGKRYNTIIYSCYNALYKNLVTKTSEIDSLFKSGWYIYNYHYCYYFAFSISRSTDSVKIERKVINPEYFLTARFPME